MKDYGFDPFIRAHHIGKEAQYLIVQDGFQSFKMGQREDRGQDARSPVCPCSQRKGKP